MKYITVMVYTGLGSLNIFPTNPDQWEGGGGDSVTNFLEYGHPMACLSDLIFFQFLHQVSKKRFCLETSMVFL